MPLRGVRHAAFAGLHSQRLGEPSQSASRFVRLPPFSFASCIRPERYVSLAARSSSPLPLRLKTSTRFPPSSRQRTASSMAAAIARDDSSAGLEHHELRHRERLDQPELLAVAHHRRLPVIPQPARMDARPHELVPERVHHHQRRRLGGVAEIATRFALRERGARCRLDGDDPVFLPRPDRSVCPSPRSSPESVTQYVTLGGALAFVRRSARQGRIGSYFAGTRRTTRPSFPMYSSAR